MSSRKVVRSARGEIVDFDYLAIKEQLAATPVPVSVNQRRKFIDEKDGIKTKENFIIPPATKKAALDEDSPLAVAAEAVETSAKAAKK